MKKFLLGVWLFLSTSLGLAQMPEKTRQEVVQMPEETRQEVAQAIQQGNYTQAVQLLQPWAERGDAWAQYRLGVMFFHGQGITQDYAQAQKWWEKAAARGDANAQFSLGVMYRDGLGVAQNDAKAREWFETENAENAEAVRKARQALERMR